MDLDQAPHRPGPGSLGDVARAPRRSGHGRGPVSASQSRWSAGHHPDRGWRGRVCGRGAAPARGYIGRDRVRPEGFSAGQVTPKPVLLKPRGAVEPVPWEEIAVDAPELKPQTPLEDAQYVALDVETTGNAPFLVLELRADRFTPTAPPPLFATPA